MHTFRKVDTKSYFYQMIVTQELRLGNRVLYKDGPRIKTISIDSLHFSILLSDTRSFFPVVLKSELLEKSGFEENKEYPLYPQAREFRLTLAVEGSGKNEIFAYIKSNGECFARYQVNGVPASSPVYHLHQLQNLYFFVCGKELEMKF